MCACVPSIHYAAAEEIRTVAMFFFFGGFRVSPYRMSERKEQERYARNVYKKRIFPGDCRDIARRKADADCEAPIKVDQEDDAG